MLKNKNSCKQKGLKGGHGCVDKDSRMGDFYYGRQGRRKDIFKCFFYVTF